MLCFWLCQLLQQLVRWDGDQKEVFSPKNLSTFFSQEKNKIQLIEDIYRVPTRMYNRIDPSWRIFFFLFPPPHYSTFGADTYHSLPCILFSVNYRRTKIVSQVTGDLCGQHACRSRPQTDSKKCTVCSLGWGYLQYSLDPSPFPASFPGHSHLQQVFDHLQHSNMQICILQAIKDLEVGMAWELATNQGLHRDAHYREGKTQSK